MIRRITDRLRATSLGTQLVGLLLLAVVAAQVISIWLFHDERRLALLEVARDNILMRSISMVQLLESTPATYHTSILKASSSRFTAFWTSGDPVVKEDADTQTEQRLETYLGSQLTPDREVHLDLLAIGHGKQPNRQNADPAQVKRGFPARLKRLAKRQVDLVLSIQLADGGWLNVATDYKPPPRTLYPLLVQMVLTIGAIFIIVFLAVRRVAKPLRHLAGAAEKLGRGEDLPALTVEGPSEVRAVTRAFNEMQDRLTRFVSDRTRMLAAISHDLRTPITSLRLRAEFIDDEENREKIIETLDEMSQMTEATLEFARDEANKEDAVRTDLTSLLESIAADQQDLGHSVSVSDGDRIILSCRPLSLKRAIRNLIENGIRYGERVEATIARDDSEAVIRFRDFGPGIPGARLADVFEPFVRLEESRSEETGGIGLGLSITRSIIHAHGGEITLRNHPDGGLEATVRLPVEPSS